MASPRGFLEKPKLAALSIHDYRIDCNSALLALHRIVNFVHPQIGDWSDACSRLIQAVTCYRRFGIDQLCSNAPDID